MAIVSLLLSILLGVFKIVAGVFTDTANDRVDEVIIVPEGSYYNYRKDRFDDGLDPYGRYDDIDHPDGDWW